MEEGEGEGEVEETVKGEASMLDRYYLVQPKEWLMMQWYQMQMRCRMWLVGGAMMAIRLVEAREEEDVEEGEVEVEETVEGEAIMLE